MHRSEHWIVVSGTARVTIGDTQQLVSENQTFYIPLGEDDIVRHEDAYLR